MCGRVEPRGITFEIRMGIETGRGTGEHRCLQRQAPRPLNSVLDSFRLGELGISPLPDYHQSLPAAVEALSRG